ncbi:bacterial Ig-like domain-containing protein [Algibacter sp. Ld11]|uniref:bacterial Ig-like domain-containing protein n=1 Tax=Algibacter sp. Ld11 TaxID=649150 RepID=UPI00386A4DC8
MKQIINFSRFKFSAWLFTMTFVVLFSACDSDDDASSSNISRVSMKTQPQLDYVLGDLLNLTDMVITLDKGGNSIDISFSDFASEGITTEPENGKSLDFSDTSVIVKIGESGKGLTQTIDVHNDVTAIEIKTEPTKDYFYGQKLNLTDLEVTYTYENGVMEDFIYTEIQKEIESVPANGDALESDTDVSITHIDSGLNVVQELNMVTFFPRGAVLVTGPENTVYNEGEIIDLSGTLIRYTLINGSEVEIGFEDFDALNINGTPANGSAINAGITEIKVKHILPTTQVSIPVTVNP